MRLTRDFKMTIVERARRDRLFAQALRNEVVALVENGEPETARLIANLLAETD